MNITDLPLWVIASIGSMCSALATGVGALPILFTKHISQKAQDIMMGFGAGIMLAATSFSLIIPAIETVEKLYIGIKYLPPLIVSTSMIIGACFLYFCDKYFPIKILPSNNESGIMSANLKRIWIFILAITIHNFPEGLAVGVGFGSESLSEAIPIAVGIGLQNMPEGLVVALALLTEDYSKSKALQIAFLTGLIEPIGGLIGFLAVSMMKALLPWGLAFAAGAMLYVIGDEIIPEAHKHGYGKYATRGLILGFIIMMFLDIALG